MAAPVERPLEEFGSAVPGFIDVFICCASFEERCTSIAKQIDPSRVGRVLMAHNYDALGDHGEALIRHFGPRATSVRVRIDQPLETADSLREALASSIAAANAIVVVDITTFTHEQLLILLGLLRERELGKRLVLVYTGAAEYMVGEEKWLSHGIREIRSVLGYPGALSPSRNIHLIVLVGFESERAERLVEEYQPAKVSLGYAMPADSISEKLSITNSKFHAELSGRLDGVQHFTFSCRDPVATKDAILAQAAKCPGYSTVVAPMNTKVSTVGSALAAWADPQIQLCYAEAKRYNIDGYSRPGSTFYLVDLLGG